MATSAAGAPPSATRWAAVLPPALLLAAGLALAALRFNDVFSLNGDNAWYVVLARNLVTGRPYNNAGFPWGYPALLAPGVALFGPTRLVEAITWLKGLSVLAFLAAIALLYALFRTRHSRPLAALTVALFVVNDVALVFTNDLMTELPYVAASAGALLYWQRGIAPAGAAGARTGRTWALAALLLALPYYVRTVGVALLAAAPVTLAWARRWRAATLLALALLALAAPWAIFSGTTAPDRNYTASLWLRDPYHPELGRIAGAGEFAQRFADRATLYGTVVLPTMLFPQPGDGPLRQVGGAAALLAALTGFALRLRKRVELPEVYVAGFLVVLFSWPWTGDRFLLPVFPFLLHYMAEALTALAGLLARGRAAARPAPVAAVAVALALLLLPNLAQDSLAIAANLSYQQGTSAGGQTVEDRMYLAACAWIATNTPPGSRILSRKSSVTELYADRPSELIPLIPPDQFLPWLESRRIDYVLEDSFAWSNHTTEHLRPALRLYPTRFRLIATIPAPGPQITPTRIWQFVR